MGHGHIGPERFTSLASVHYDSMDFINLAVKAIIAQL